MNIPGVVKQILQDRELSMPQKMVAFMAFMPKLPDDPKLNAILVENVKIGNQIKELVDKEKIQIHGFDKSFKIKVQC